jgi:hypothetical protein
MLHTICLMTPQFDTEAFYKAYARYLGETEGEAKRQVLDDFAFSVVEQMTIEERRTFISLASRAAPKAVDSATP